jgi:hypothetical protein
MLGYGGNIINNTTQTIERHFHHKNRTFGKSADQSGNNWATEDSLTPFRATSGNGVYGADANDEAKVFGSSDTPFISGHLFFDPGLIQVMAASVDTVYIIRLIWGLGTMADAIAAGQYSSIPARFDSVNPQLTAFLQIPVGCARLSVGTKVWIQIKNVTNNATMDFYHCAHGYSNQ